MIAGMAGVIAAHKGIAWEESTGRVFCECDIQISVLSASLQTQYRKLYEHAADELTKAGYGNVQEALLSAADEMPIETLQGADKASAWLRRRAHGQDPGGQALVKAIHDRKAEG